MDDNLYVIVSYILVGGLKYFWDSVFKVYLDDIKYVSLGSEGKIFKLNVNLFNGLLSLLNGNDGNRVLKSIKKVLKK